MNDENNNSKKNTTTFRLTLDKTGITNASSDYNMESVRHSSFHNLQTPDTAKAIGNTLLDSFTPPSYNVISNLENTRFSSDGKEPLLVSTPEDSLTKERKISIVLNTTGNKQSILLTPGARDNKLLISPNDEKQKNKINTDTKTKNKATNEKFRHILNLCLRCAVGTLLAGMIQTRKSDCNLVLQNERNGLSQWILFPDKYYIGGLSYAAVMVISMAGKNLGETLKYVWQAAAGITIALLWSMMLFTQIKLPSISSLNSLRRVTKTSFSGKDYPIDDETFYLVLPALTFFTFVVLLIPISSNTKKFAVGMNLYFAFTVIKPNNRILHQPQTTLYNLAVYFLVGLVGSLISIMTMLLPTPILALRAINKKATETGCLILETYNMIIDFYCFKKVSKSNLEFLDLRLCKRIAELNTHIKEIKILLDDAGWEQILGLHWLLNTDKKVLKHYVNLCSELVEDVKSMHFALIMKGSDTENVLHTYYMKMLTKRIYVLQTHSCTLFQDIYDGIANSKTKLSSKIDFRNLESRLERLLDRYEMSRQRLASDHPPIESLTVEDYEKNMSLNHFLFSLHSFCTTLVEFQRTYNNQDFRYERRIRKFMNRLLHLFIDPNQYSMQNIIATCKVTTAVVIGMFFTVYVFDYDSTCPAAIAYVMGNHIGGSFSTTVNRVAGVVAGSVIPAIISFFICHISNTFITNFFSNIFLLLWVVVSMYVYFSGGYSAYAGYVSAFVSTSIFLTQCPCNGSLSAGITYSSLAQTSVGMFIFIIIELSFVPHSALRLLRGNIQKVLRQSDHIFDEIFSRYITLEKKYLDGNTKDEMENNLLHVLPSLLIQQKDLLFEANLEPLLWRAEFCYDKYQTILTRCDLLLNNLRLLFNLVKWYTKRLESPEERQYSENETPDASNAGSRQAIESVISSKELRNGVSSTNSPCALAIPADMDDAVGREKWFSAATRLRYAVKDVFKTLTAIFAEVFFSSNSEQTALYMIMKEAFRIADTDGNGEISAIEVAVLIKNILGKYADFKEDEISQYVEEFMELVDKDNSGQVSFEEFMNALDNGLVLDMDVLAEQNLPKLDEERVSLVQSGMSDKEAEEKLMIRRSQSMVQVERKPEDFLTIENFLLTDIMKDMKTLYVKWLFGSKDNKNSINTEQVLLLNCIICGTEGIVKNLTEIEEAIAAT